MSVKFERSPLATISGICRYYQPDGEDFFTAISTTVQTCAAPENLARQQTDTFKSRIACTRVPSLSPKFYRY
ncbi:MAG: hypothetical protein V7K48_24860 [Nostoc sp.]|uniref:hypothetical protein n=1 Tax=Nostoc sp. TaxID=1180 RepID=UPI002FF55241